MYKTLIKKQLLELFVNLYTSQSMLSGKKNKKPNKGANIAVTAFVYFILFKFCLFMAYVVGKSSIPAGLDWFFFCMFGLGGFCFCLFLNIFMGHKMLFQSKDNAFLLSLPVTPQAILISRIVVLLVNCLFGCLLFWVPAIISYILIAQFSAIVFISNIIMWIAISLIVILLSCLIAFIIAKTIKNKNLKIILSILGFAIFAVAIGIIQIGPSGKMDMFIDSLMSIGAYIQENIPLLYYFGKACCGDIIPLISFFGVAVVLSALMMFILNKTFIGIVTYHSTAKYKEYKAKNQKTNRPSFSLFKKELSFLIKTPSYLFNAGAGIVLLVVFGFMFFMNIDTAMNYLNHIKTIEVSSFNPADVILLGLTIFSFFACSINCLTVPSVSLEGKTVWILRSLPVTNFEVFKSKILLSVVYSTITCAIFTFIACIALDVSLLYVPVSAVATIIFATLTSSFGMLIGIKRANFDWTNIMIPIKSNINFLYYFLFGLAMTIVYSILCVVTFMFTGVYVAMAIGALIQCVITFLLLRAIKQKSL